jgi:hypothetical protein
MSNHFTSFTVDTMKAFGQDLADLAQHRTESITNIRNHTEGMLAGFLKEFHDAAAKRRNDAAEDAEARRNHLNALRAEVQSLRETFTAEREAMATDIREMAAELRQACETFRNRPRADQASPAKESPRSSGRGKNKHNKSAE